jgi:hypothetical protein
MATHGVTAGFQWLNGSFMTDIEKSENRPPSDIDVVTFHERLSITQMSAILNRFPEFADPVLSKSKYSIDHYPVDYCHDPNLTVDMTRYWIQLFTHTKNGVWKGIIRVEINTPAVDQLALNYLNGLLI